jgi:hypothetical protein
MCETGHSETRDELRLALLQLEEALARHEGQAAATRDDRGDPALQVLRRSVGLMRQEAERLRAMLAQP